jgi:hypothetical protein
MTSIHQDGIFGARERFSLLETTNYAKSKLVGSPRSVFGSGGTCAVTGAEAGMQALEAVTMVSRLVFGGLSRYGESYGRTGPFLYSIGQGKWKMRSSCLGILDLGIMTVTSGSSFEAQK